MATRKHYKGGVVVRYEPTYMKLLEEDPTFVQSFANMGCLRFCQKLQGFHAQITKDFTLNFTGIGTKVGILSLNVSPDTISHATEIPRSGETWFKVQKFQLQNCDEFLKEEHQGIDMTVGIPRTCLRSIIPSC
jgi:hypothetical protein